MQRFTVELKTLFGLAMPNQYCPTVKMQILISISFYKTVLGSA